MRCRLCNYAGNNFKKYISKCKFNKEELIRFQCPACDVIFGNERMLNLNQEQMIVEYDSVKHLPINEDLATKYELEFFNSVNLDKNKRYINMGAGIWSHAVTKLQSVGYNIINYDPYCKINNPAISNKFDGVLTHNVIEHYQNPIKEIKAIRNILKPNGFMAHATPCYEYCFEWTRFHLFFYCGRSINKLCEICKIKKTKDEKLKNGQHVMYFRPIG